MRALHWSRAAEGEERIEPDVCTTCSVWWFDSGKPAAVRAAGGASHEHGVASAEEPRRSTLWDASTEFAFQASLFRP